MLRKFLFVVFGLMGSYSWAAEQEICYAALDISTSEIFLTNVSDGNLQTINISCLDAYFYTRVEINGQDVPPRLELRLKKVELNTTIAKLSQRLDLSKNQIVVTGLSADDVLVTVKRKP